MSTTIINPAPSSDSSGNNGMGMIFGVIVLIVIAALFIFYALPYIRGLSGSGGVQVNLPKDINVNVKQTK